MDQETRDLIEGWFDYEPMLLVDYYVRELYAKDKKVLNNEFKNLIHKFGIIDINAEEPLRKKRVLMRVVYHQQAGTRRGAEILGEKYNEEGIYTGCEDLWEEEDDVALIHKPYSGYVLPDPRPISHPERPLSKEYFIAQYKDDCSRAKQYARAMAIPHDYIYEVALRLWETGRGHIDM